MIQRPNILVILSDQLRRQALEIYGDPHVATPSINALAKTGVRFANACSTYPVCVPFRFTLMTGEYAHSRFVPRAAWRMSPAERTLADEFNEAGYETFYVGKWHLYGGHGVTGHSYVKSGMTPVPRLHQCRFQHWRGFEIRNDHFDTYYFVDDDPTPHPIEQYQTDGLFDLGTSLIKQRDVSRPFFGIISVEPPHNPFIAPSEMVEKWKNREIGLPPNVPASSQDERIRLQDFFRQYYGMIENLDANVERLTAFLDSCGLRENTVIVFLSDHGELGGSHDLRAKSWPYEESIGIPLIISDPRVPQCANTVVDVPVCTEDLFPTLLGLAGLTPKHDLPGLDLAPLMHGTVEHLARDGVYLEFVFDINPKSKWGLETWRGFRSRRYKYTVLGGAEGGRPWQFFDLQKDPYEMNNLIEVPHAMPEISRHHGLLRDSLIATGDHYVLAPAYGYEGANLWF